MSILDKNIAALRKSGFKTQDLDKYIADNINKQRVKLVEARDGNKVIEYTKPTGEEVCLNSRYRPKEEAAKWAEQFNAFVHNKLYLVYGFGNGNHVRELCSRLKDNDILFVYEPSIEIFAEVMTHIDISDILSCPYMSLDVEGINSENMQRDVVQCFRWHNLFNMRILELPKYDLLFGEERKKFLAACEAGREHEVSNIVTIYAYAEVRVANTCITMAKLHEMISFDDCMNYIPKGGSVIIVAAGPSLEKNIEDVRKAKGKAFVLATDTALKVLLKRDIIPDAFVCVDPTKFDDLVYDDDRVYEIPLFCVPVSSYRLLRYRTGKNIMYNIGYRIINDLFEKLDKSIISMEGGGSVATVAYAIATRLQFKKIILIGQDLSFPNNKTHITGAFDNIELSDSVKSNDVFVEDIYGNMVRTIPNLKNYLNWFNRVIPLNKNATVIDATEGGAKIDGTLIMTLKEAIDNYCDDSNDYTAIFDEMQPTFSKEDKKKLDVEFRNIIDRYNVLSDKAKHGAEVNEKRYKKYCAMQTKNPEFIKLEDELEELDNFIENSTEMTFIDELIRITEYSMVRKAAELQNDRDAIKQRIKNKSLLYTAIAHNSARVALTMENILDGSFYKKFDTKKDQSTT